MIRYSRDEREQRAAVRAMEDGKRQLAAASSGASRRGRSAKASANPASTTMPTSPGSAARPASPG